MTWADHLNLSDYKVAAGPFGGPIALMKKDQALSKSGAVQKPLIIIYNAAGKDISMIKWTGGALLDFAWSLSEKLLFVQEDGNVLVYNIFGVFERQFATCPEAKDIKLLEFKVYNSYSGTGIALMTNAYRIYLINDIEEPSRIRRLAEIPGASAPPSSWCAISRDTGTRVLAAYDDKLYVLEQEQCYRQELPMKTQDVVSCTEMAVSFNNKFLCIFTASGILWVGTADLQSSLCEFDTKSRQRPRQLLWCGTGAVAAMWDQQDQPVLLVIGPKKDWISFTDIASEALLVQEPDGIRIIANRSHEFLQRVPDAVDRIFKIGSLDPGAYLFEASRYFKEEDIRADEYIRTIEDQLPLAVECCIDAASEEYDPAVQMQLLRAASFGRCFLPSIPPQHFVDTCKTLRVLNSVRDFNLGIPLTYRQLQALQLEALIDRLVYRRQYALAVEICKYMRMHESKIQILSHWACYKVQQMQESEDNIARAIYQKLGDSPGVSYSEIATKAVDCGRTELAVKLLDHEPRASKQVPLLMKIKQYRAALNKALDSGDSDLVYDVLFKLRTILGSAEFFMELRNSEMATALYMQYCREQSPEQLENIYNQDDRHEDIALAHIVRSCQASPSSEMKLIELKSASDRYRQSRNEWGVQMTSEAAQLLRIQRKLEEELRLSDLCGLPLHRTLFQLFLHDHQKQAEALRRDFKVTERRYWYIMVDALAERGDWIELEKFSKSKKVPPIGYEPFVNACVAQRNEAEAGKYAQRAEPEIKVKCLIKMGRLEAAADAAFEHRNMASLNLVLARCGLTDRALADKVQQLKAQLQQR